MNDKARVVRSAVDATVERMRRERSLHARLTRMCFKLGRTRRGYVIADRLTDMAVTDTLTLDQVAV